MVAEVNSGKIEPFKTLAVEVEKILSTIDYTVIYYSVINRLKWLRL